MPLAHYPLRATILRHKADTNTTGRAFDEYEVHLEGVPVYFETLSARAREFWEARGLHSETSGRVRMRYIAGITVDMRIVVGGRTFDIVPPVDNVRARNKELVLAVKEVL